MALAGFGPPGHQPSSFGSFDKEIATSPSDAVSSLSFSPISQRLAATSWGSTTTCWQVSAEGATGPEEVTHHSQPVLCSAWSANGSSIFSGGCSGDATLWDLQSSQTRTVAQHEAPIRHLQFLPQLGLLVTGSWDRSLRVWDARTPQPALAVQLPERVYALHAAGSTLVVGTAGRHVQVFDLRSPGQPASSKLSRLGRQTTCLACFPDGQGFVLGCLDGRAAVEHLQPGLDDKDFTFKCHRTDEAVHCVNAVAFHPHQHDCLATAGSDGGLNMWNKGQKKRIKRFTPQPQPITAIAFSADATWLAYAASYDWGKGMAGHRSGREHHKILLHRMVDADLAGPAGPRIQFGQQQGAYRR